MRPLRLEIENLRSFRTKRVIDFGGLEIVAILGDTGAGKTSILEAVTYALFNRSTWSGRNVKELMTRGASTMTVVFTFSVDDVEYQIVRITKARGTSQHRLMCPQRGIDVSGEAGVEEAVRNALHLDDTAFLHTVLLPQDKHAELLTKEQRERNRILSELFRLDDLAKVCDLARLHESRADVALGALRRQREQYGADPATRVADAEQSLRAAEDVLTRANAVVDAVQKIDAQTAECNKTAEVHRRRLQLLEPAANHLRALESLDAIELEFTPQLEAQQRARADAEALKKAAEEEADQLRTTGRDLATLRAVKQTLEGVRVDLREVQAEHKRETEAKAKLDDAQRRMDKAKSALESAEAKYTKAEAACNRAADAIRGDEARVSALETALSDFRNAKGRRDTLLTRRDVRKQLVDSLRADVEKARAATVSAKQKYDDAVKAREAAQVAQQAASCAQHLHAGDDCPVCHRALPKGFKPPGVPEVTKAQENERQRQAVHQYAVGKENTLIGRLRAESESLANDERDMEQAEGEYSAAVANVRMLLPAPEDDPEQLLARYAKRVAQAEKQLPQLHAAVSECNALLSSARSEYASAQADHRNYSEVLAQLAASISTRLGRCRDLCASIPKALRPEIDSDAVAKMLTLVNDVTHTAESVEARVGSANQSIAAAVSELAQLHQRLTREVVAPRAALYSQLGSIARVLDLPAMPEDDKRRAKWAQSVEKAAQSEQSRLAKDVEAISARCQQLSSERAELVARVGGEPRDMASEALLRKRDAEHALEDARKKVAEAAAVDEKVARLKPVRMGLGALRDALGAREFPAYATQQRQRRLLEEATLIFREMTDERYGFTEDFEIFDRETNDARSPHTLSGGEKFLASLALSLAVVEIASNAGAKIEALFLDEGFASLDAATLELAMLELRKRSHAGRMICVISHISQVTQFVNDTILVEETADGSAIRRQSGPIDDDASVVEGLVSHLTAQTA